MRLGSGRGRARRCESAIILIEKQIAQYEVELLEQTKEKKSAKSKNQFDELIGKLEKKIIGANVCLQNTKYNLSKLRR